MKHCTNYKLVFMFVEIKLPQQVDKLLKNEVKLNEEIQNLCKESEKVLQSVELNWKCCEAIQIALEPEFGKCKAYPFGSRVSGLGTIVSCLHYSILCDI